MYSNDFILLSLQRVVVEKIVEIVFLNNSRGENVSVRGKE